ncbi:O-antigen ligase family protein [Thermoflavimicrobium daqui]|nr:O-antigen ligase family protein [Thermoflavimicrobium daqui]
MYMMKDNERGFYFLSITVYLIVFWFFSVGVVTYFQHSLVKTIFSGYTVAAVLSSTLAMLSFFHLIPNSNLFLKYERATALFKDPNVFGPFLIPIAIYSILKMEQSKIKLKMRWIFVFFLTTTGVLLSFSRAAWLNYCLSLVVYLLLRVFHFEEYKLWIRLGFMKFIIIPIVIFFIALLGFVYLEQLNEFFIQRFGFQTYDDDRFATQMDAIQQGIQNPLGIGPGQSEIIYLLSTHNLYIRVFTESGFIGFLGLIGLLIITLKRCIRFSFLASYQKQAYFALYTAVLIGIFANSLFIDSLHWRHLWLFLSVPWAYIPQKSESANNLGNHSQKKNQAIPD